MLTRIGIRGSAGLVVPRELVKMLGYPEVLNAPSWLRSKFENDLEVLKSAIDHVTARNKHREPMSI